MDKLDLIIRNGNVILETGIQKLDIGIRGGKFVMLQESILVPAKKVYEADGYLIFPGMIDVHVHFNEPGRQDWEGFHSGSYMMAAGGGTTFFDMPLNGIPSTTTVEALLEKATIGNQKSRVDFGLWGGLVPGNEEHIPGLASQGVIGFKAFLSPTGNKEFEAIDDTTLLRGMQEIAKTNKVLALHSESGPIIQHLTDQVEQKSTITADDYASTRPIKAEVEAVERALHYAELTDCPLHFVHISSQEAVEKIEEAKQKGLNITVETCGHYLLFSHQDLVKKGAIAKCAPPLREENEQRKLIRLLEQDRFDMVTSDHSPSPVELKDSSYNLLEAWGGISGGQFILLTLIELALEHAIPFEKVAAWTSTNPAERFNLSQKGKIETGRDADLTIVNPNQPFTVTRDTYHAKHKQTPYMDHTFPCRIESTCLRGGFVYHHNERIADAPIGSWLTT